MQNPHKNAPYTKEYIYYIPRYILISFRFLHLYINMIIQQHIEFTLASYAVEDLGVIKLGLCKCRFRYAESSLFDSLSHDLFSV